MVWSYSQSIAQLLKFIKIYPLVRAAEYTIDKDQSKNHSFGFTERSHRNFKLSRNLSLIYYVVLENMDYVLGEAFILTSDYPHNSSL